MYRLRRYLLKNLSLLFLSIFIPLFAIASIIFLIKLATYTSVIQLSVKDMVTLYLFVLPEVFFYTLPVTFFIAASISLYRLSQENESTVLFALGITPATIYAIYFRPAILLSLLLFFDFFVMFPHATVLSTNYLRYKQSEAQFNLQASEYGHSFGDWMLYIGSAKSDNLYSDVFLFKNDPNEELLINANEASIVNSGNVLSLKLESGKGYNFKKNILTQMNFQTLYINNSLTANLRPYHSTLDFWLDIERRDNKIKMFITDSLLSIFPVASLFIVLAIAIVHTRHKNSYIYLYLFLTIITFYGATLSLQPLLGFYTIAVVLFLLLSIGFGWYRHSVLKRF